MKAKMLGHGQNCRAEIWFVRRNTEGWRGRNGEVSAA